MGWDCAANGRAAAIDTAADTSAGTMGRARFRQEHRLEVTAFKAHSPSVGKPPLECIPFKTCSRHCSRSRSSASPSSSAGCCCSTVIRHCAAEKTGTAAIHGSYHRAPFVRPGWDHGRVRGRRGGKMNTGTESVRGGASTHMAPLPLPSKECRGHGRVVGLGFWRGKERRSAIFVARLLLERP